MGRHNLHLQGITHILRPLTYISWEDLKKGFSTHISKPSHYDWRVLEDY